MNINEIHWTTQASYPVLTVLQLLPLASMITVLLLRKSRYIVQIGTLLAVAELLIAVDIYRLFDHTQTALQLVEHIQFFGVLSWHVGVDGISVLFILLSNALTLMLVLYSRIRKLNPPGLFMAVLFAIVTTLQAMHVTQNLLMFAIMSGIELMLIGYLLHRWASFSDGGLCEKRYFQFMGTGIVLLLAGTLMLGWNYAELHNGHWSFNINDLKSTAVSDNINSIVFFLLFYGLAVRIPLFPMHGWMPLIAEHGTVAVSGVLLLGLKTGVYGLIHFVMPVLPNAILQWQEFIVAFALIGIFYAAILALMQTNLRRLLAFAVISHTSVLVIGLFTLNHAAFQGSMMLSVNFGLATSLLLFMAGLVYHRTHTMQLSRLGGLFDHIPFIGIAFLIAGLSIIGMPGTPGFDAVHLMLEASIVRFGALLTIAAALGNVIAAGFLLYAFQRAFLSPRDESLPVMIIEKATRTEIILAASMILTLLWAGFHTEPWLDLMENTLKVLESQFGQSSSGHTMLNLKNN